MRIIEKLQQAVETVCLSQRNITPLGRPKVGEVINRRSKGADDLRGEPEGVACPLEGLNFLFGEASISQR